MIKFRFGCPLEPDLGSGEKWDRFKAFDMASILRSIFTGLFIAGVIAAVWLIAFTGALPIGTPSWMDMLLAVAVTLFVHELFHLIGFPKMGLDGSARIGIWPELCAPYVQYLLPVSRNRFIFAAGLPFLMISIIPLFFTINNTLPIEYLSWISVINCVGTGSDIFILMKLLRTVPRNALVIESGEDIYWRAR